MAFYLLRNLIQLSRSQFKRYQGFGEKRSGKFKSERASHFFISLSLSLSRISLMLDSFGKSWREWGRSYYRTRPALSQVWNTKICSLPFLNYIKFTDLLILRLWNCGRIGRVGGDLIHSLFPTDWLTDWTHLNSSLQETRPNFCSTCERSWTNFIRWRNFDRHIWRCWYFKMSGRGALQLNLGGHFSPLLFFFFSFPSSLKNICRVHSFVLVHRWTREADRRKIGIVHFI